ncbi:helix-turn-helix transcriptional regulator [Parabacteroides sp. OttesenSCG-928-K15]|nr:helix-turn-helix transcriptional regulator [Parabacteroides sp. OttesenSCG-928-K15]
MDGDKLKASVSDAHLAKIIARFPEVNLEWLLTGTGIMTKEPSTGVAKTDRTSDLFAEIPVVDISMAAGDGFLNGDFVDVSDFILLPKSWIKDGRLYLCGKIKGDSMHPTLQNDSYLIMRLLNRSEWADVKDGYVYVLSTREGKTVVKRTKNRLKEHGFIVCSSDNPDKIGYPNFNLEEEEINTIWYAEWYISAKMPNIHETYYEKQSKLEDKVDNIISEFEQIKKSFKRLSS